MAELGSGQEQSLNSLRPIPNTSGRPSWEPVRLRVSRACDRCKKKKIRCTGTQPCALCQRASAGCEYAAPHNRGRRPPPVYGNGTNNSWSTYNEQESSLMDSPGGSSGRVGHRNFDAPPQDSNQPDVETELPSRSSPEPVTDLQGHYIGPASGVSFLARVQRRLHQTKSTLSNFTFNDVPFPDFDPTPSVMVSREEASRLVQKFFEFTMPIDRFFHQPTIEKWLQEFLDTMGAMGNADDAPARRAALWMIFAMAQEHMSQDTSAVDEDQSIRYFLAADYQLSKIKGIVNLTAVQARLCQCFWLLARSRVNHCWELFGSTARLALVLGLHRKHSPAWIGSCSPIDLDCCRRTFWSAYCLDNHLSITFGRPKIFHDDDIDQELPCGANDQDLLQEHRPSSHTVHAYSVMLAPIAYYKLHSTVSTVLRELYSIRPVTLSAQCAQALKYSQIIKDWRDTIPRFLTAESQESAPLIPIFQRQRDVLNVSYWHALVLLHRPLLLRKFVLAQGSSQDDIENAQLDTCVDECLTAALRILEKVEEMFESRLMFRSFWGSCYYGFCAAVVLYVYAILPGSASSPTYQTYLNAAIRYQNQLLRLTGAGSLLARYCVVLEELQQEALGHTQNESSPPTVNQGTMSETAAVGNEMISMSIENINNILCAPVAGPDIYGGFIGFQPGNIIEIWPQGQSLTGNTGMI